MRHLLEDGAIGASADPLRQCRRHCRFSHRHDTIVSAMGTLNLGAAVVAEVATDSRTNDIDGRDNNDNCDDGDDENCDDATFERSAEHAAGDDRNYRPS
jgi:hypothetical protein